MTGMSCFEFWLSLHDIISRLTVYGEREKPSKEEVCRKKHAALTVNVVFPVRLSTTDLYNAILAQRALS